MKSADMTVTMVGSYDMSLVFLSYVIAAVASFVALDLAGRVTASQGSARKLWLMGGRSPWGLEYGRCTLSPCWRSVCR